jgi:hypothetical protein
MGESIFGMKRTHRSAKQWYSKERGIDFSIKRL